MAHEDDDRTKVLGKIYQASMQNCAWEEVWRSVMAHLSSTSRTLSIDTHPGVDAKTFPGFSETALSLYESHYYNGDPWLIEVARRAVGGVRLTEDFVPAAVFGKTGARDVRDLESDIAAI